MTKKLKNPEIKQLKKITLYEHQSFGHNGYKSKVIYELFNDENIAEINFKLKHKELDSEYIKEWAYSEAEIENYNKLISEGNSFGVYYNSNLIGVAITEECGWNNTLWIEYIAIAEQYRGMCIGSLLLDKISELAIEKKVRAITLETQNTNLTAINFYRKNGFVISGFDLFLYNQPADKDEVAIFMTKLLDIK